MQQNPNRLKLIAVLAGAGILLLIVWGIASTSSGPQPSPVTSSDDTAGSANSPDVETQPSDQQATQQDETPTDSNITRLMDKGASSKQIDTLQYAFFQFSQKSGVPIRNMIIDTNSIRHTLPDFSAQQYNHIYTFRVSFGKDKNYNAQMVDIGGSQLRLILTDPSSKAVVHDSGVIDVNAVSQ
jgi:hypothetical protein